MSQQITVTLPDELLDPEAFRQILREELERAQWFQSDDMLRLIDRHEAAVFLGVKHPDQISQWAAAGLIPFVRINGTRRYRKADLLRHLPSQIAGGADEAAAA